MEKLSAFLNQNDLKQIFELLNLACSGSNTEQQAQVFQKISQLETNSIAYCYFAYFFCNPQINLSIREMAGLTLKSALGRNKMILNDEHYEAIREVILGQFEQSNPKIMTTKGVIISQLIIYRQTDYLILNFLVNRLGNEKALKTLIIILEDLRFNNENFEIFGEDKFVSFMRDLILGLEKLYNTNQKLQAMKCMNLVIYPLPQLLLDLLTRYMSKILIPSLSANISYKSYNKQQLVLALQGLQAIAQTKKDFIKQSTIELLSKLDNNDKQIRKIQANLWMEIIDADTQQYCKDIIELLLRKFINGLQFSKEDEYNLKNQQKSAEYNMSDQPEDSQCVIMRGGQFTLRKASVFCLTKLSQQYEDVTWSKISSLLESGLLSENWKQKQAIVLLVGIVAPQSEQYIEPHLSSFLQLLLNKVENPLIFIPYLTSTILWTLQKLCGLIIKSKQLTQKTLRYIFSRLQTQDSLVKQSGYSVLDQFLQGLEANIPLQYLNIIIKIAIQGIMTVQGRTLFSAFRLLSQIYQYSSPSISIQTSKQIIQVLCSKWQQNQKIDTYVCPLVECLVTISGKSTEAFNFYVTDIFLFCLKTVHSKDRKDYVLRILDLFSSILNLKNPKISAQLSQPEIPNVFLNLLSSEQKQIKDFAYGVLSDIISNSQNLSNIEFIIKTVASSIDKNNLTNLNNGLLCLTQILTSYPVEIVGKYVLEILSLTIQVLTKPHLQHIILANFAKVAGRLCNINLPSELGHQYHHIYPHIKTLCYGLRVKQSSIHTNQAFAGLFRIISQNLEQNKQNMEYVVDSFICYPCEDMALINTFKYLMLQFKSKVTQNQWLEFQNRPIFLPGTLIKLNRMLATQ